MRKPGYYWVLQETDGLIEIGLYNGQEWLLMGNEAKFVDHDFADIIEFPIIPEQVMYKEEPMMGMVIQTATPVVYESNVSQTP